MDVQAQVREFHEKFGLPVGNIKISSHDFMLRRNLIKEEWEEVNDAYYNKKDKHYIKELCDLIYVIVGTFVSLGIDFNEVFKRVHENNMSKIGKDGRIRFRNDGKILKPDNYKPVDLSDLVK